jgi:hypothetical protein
MKMVPKYDITVLTFDETTAAMIRKQYGKVRMRVLSLCNA